MYRTKASRTRCRCRGTWLFLNQKKVTYCAKRRVRHTSS